MNKAKLSNTLRSLGLLYAVDKLRFRYYQLKNRTSNLAFKARNPSIKLPPDYLMYESFQLNYGKYYFGGEETAKWLIGLLSEHISLNGHNILDWGCGPGRIVRHLPSLLGIKNAFYATDYNTESIDWCNKNINGVAFNKNQLDASLPYQDSFFDAIYGISIFTHLSKQMHECWLSELMRVLKVGGILLVTTQGENFKPILSDTEKTKFATGELIVRGNVKEGHRTYSAFHPDQYLTTFFKDLTVIDKIIIDPADKSYTPQDVWILKK